MSRQPLLHMLARYRDAFPAEAAMVDRICRLVESHANCFDRTCRPGHITSAAWILSNDRRRALLTHHRKLDRWLQPGGHADGDTDLARVALREAEEETGLGDLVLEPGIYDLDRHLIPARKQDPEHYHYDVRFVVRALGSERFTVSDESHALEWRPVRDVAEDENVDPSVRRMARKWLARR